MRVCVCACACGLRVCPLAAGRVPAIARVTTAATAMAFQADAVLPVATAARRAPTRARRRSCKGAPPHGESAWLSQPWRRGSVPVSRLGALAVRRARTPVWTLGACGKASKPGLDGPPSRLYMPVTPGCCRNILVVVVLVLDLMLGHGHLYVPVGWGGLARGRGSGLLWMLVAASHSYLPCKVDRRPR